MCDEGMDKYGVQFDEEKTKEASKGTSTVPVCPLCSSRLDSGGACPTHGTEPFEQTPKR